MRAALRVLSLIALFVAGSVPAQESLCAGKYRTTVIGGSDRAGAIAAIENTLVTAHHDSLTTWDLTDRQNPTRLGQWISGRSTRYWSYGRVDQVGLDPRGFAYVGVTDGLWPLIASIEVFDLRNVEVPRPILSLRERWEDFVLFDNLLIGLNERLDIIDVSDPFHPIPVCDACFEFSKDMVFDTSMAISGEHLVVVSGWNFWVVDISDPSRPLEIFHKYIDGVGWLWVEDDLALLTREAIDLSDPTQPVAYDHGLSLGYGWVEFRGYTAYIGQPGGARVRVIDFSDFGNPIDLGVIDITSESGEMVGDILYLSSVSGLHVLDVTGVPTEVNQPISWEQATWISVDEGLGIVTGSDAVKLLDISNPTGPMEIDRFRESSWTGRAVMRNRVAAIPLIAGGVSVVVVDSGDALVHSSEIPTGDCFARHLDLEDSTLTVGLDCLDGSGAVELYDLAYPDRPDLLARFDSELPVHAAIWADDLVFATQGGSVIAVDFSDREVPVVRSSSQIVPGCSGSLQALAKQGDCLIIGSSDEQSPNCGSRLVALDVWSPDDPVIGDETRIDVAWLSATPDVVVGGNGDDLVIADYSTYCQETTLRRYEYPRQDTWGGAIQENTLYLGSRHSIDELDLQCSPPETDFTWCQVGTEIRFDDRTTMERASTGNGPYQKWTWKFSNGVSYEYGGRTATIDFKLPGRYTATLDVRTEMGTTSVTKTIDVLRESTLSSEVRNSEGRVAP